jgi:hypothetical protein
MDFQMTSGGSVVMSSPDNAKNEPMVAALKAAVDSWVCDKKPRIAIEFECGDCCKKVLNGAKIFFKDYFVILLPAEGEFLLLKLFSCGKLVEKQVLAKIVIPVKRICSVEFGAIEIDP